MQEYNQLGKQHQRSGLNWNLIPIATSIVSVISPSTTTPMHTTYLPRYHVGRRWSPDEILAIKLPSDVREKTRQNSAAGVRKTMAARAGGREKKKAERKNMILSFIISKGKITTTGLLSLMGEKMNRTTLCELIKELQAEGLIHKAGWEWALKIGTINDLPN